MNLPIKEREDLLEHFYNISDYVSGCARCEKIIALIKRGGGIIKNPKLAIFKSPGCLGYMPNKGSLDSVNPPKGGSGVPPKNERYDIECDLLRDIIKKRRGGINVREKRSIRQT